MARVLILFAHPALQKSRVNRRLIDAVQNLKNMTINDLYEEHPDFFVDVKREQDLLLTYEAQRAVKAFRDYDEQTVLTRAR